MCNQLPKSLFPEKQQEEKASSLSADSVPNYIRTSLQDSLLFAEKKMKTVPPRTAGTPAWHEAKRMGIEIKHPHPVGPNGLPRKTGKPKPKTLNVGAGSKKGLPSQCQYPLSICRQSWVALNEITCLCLAMVGTVPKKAPPQDWSNEQALRHILGAGSFAPPPPSASSESVASPELASSSVTTISETRLDWAEEMDKHEEDQQQHKHPSSNSSSSSSDTDEQSPKNLQEQTPTWNAAATWPNWEDDDDGYGVADDASSLAARSKDIARGVWRVTCLLKSDSFSRLHFHACRRRAIHLGDRTFVGRHTGSSSNSSNPCGCQEHDCTSSEWESVDEADPCQCVILFGPFL